MKKLLVTGGTVFVSKFTANYFADKNYEVYVLNRNTKKQLENVHLICADRNDLQDVLKSYHFDAVIDVSGYARKDIQNLTAALNPVDDYIFISSSAVYPDTNPQPFTEEQTASGNPLWGTYGTDKSEAEEYLFSQYPDAYVLRPAYLYGPMEDIYREPFVFDCAYRIEIKVYVTDGTNQRDYFCFRDYEYVLDVEKQTKILPQTKSLEEGLKESFDWYLSHPEDVEKREYISFIDKFLSK